MLYPTQAPPRHTPVGWVSSGERWEQGSDANRVQTGWVHCANFHKTVSPPKRALFTTMSSLKIEEAPLPAGTAPEPLNQSVQEFRLHHCPRAMPTVSDHHVMPPSMPTHNLHWHASRYYGLYEVRAIWEGNQEKGRPQCLIDYHINHIKPDPV